MLLDREVTERADGRVGEDESLLVLSDVHLGSDLNDHQARSSDRRRSQLVDVDLVRLVEHYQRTLPKGRRWRLVIAGDFIDFIGIALLPQGHLLSTEPSAEELEHGLGNAADHARVKLRKVAERHPEVFAALAQFVAAGNALTLVHGNHDVEFHWDVVKDDFRTLLADLARPDDRDAFVGRIQFNPWFFYADGLAYIEHGHQYDPLCANQHVIMPVSPTDPRRIARGFCDVLLRFVVRPTRGIREHGHESLGVLSYVALGARLGTRGLFKLFSSFFRAVWELFRVRREWFSDKAQALREEHERRMGLLADAMRIGIDRLKALAALHAPPVTRTIGGIMASVLLDRIALGLGSLLLLTAVAILGAYNGMVWIVAPCVLLAWFLSHRYLAKKRKLDPDDDLIERAGRLVKLFPAAFVVMGHTHTPLETKVLGGEATYINVGAWSEEEPAQGEASYRAPRTHLVIEQAESGPVAELRAWDATGVPLRFDREHKTG